MTSETPRAVGPTRLPGYSDPPKAFTALFLAFVIARYISVGARRAFFATIRTEFTLGLLLTILCIGLLVLRPLSLRSARSILVAISLLFFAMVVQVPFAARM